LLSINDPLTARRNVNLVRNSQLRVTEELKQKKELQSQEQLAKEKALRMAYTIALIFIVLSAFLFLRNIRQRHAAQQKMAEQQKKMADIELSEVRSQIDAYVQLLILKNTQIKEANDAVELLKTENERVVQIAVTAPVTEPVDAEPESAESAREAEKKLMNEKILTKDDWLNFIQLFNRLHPHFINTIETKYPALTASEIRYCVLTRLSLSNKHIASMLGVGEDAARQTASRINKKLHLKSKIEIVDLVMGID
jgi:DNA-binding CsgD family transcriptional regulator